jgi:flagellar M-ring protein FliF
MPSLSSLRDFWRSLESRSQITLVVSLLAVVATMYAIYHFASQPSYTTIETGLSASSSGRVTDALSSAGISYKLADGGTSVQVQDGQQDEARIALGKAGVTPGGHTDFSIFDKSSLSDTDFQQQVNYQRALEGTIASTIEGIDGVDAAQVQVVLPKDQLFQDEASQATASVMITASLGLDSSTVRGVAHMVASSVQGLDPNDVTITDQTGALLWPSGDGGGGGGAPSKLQAQQAYGAQLSSQIDAMLARTLGPGKAEARVAVDLNVDETTKDSITYGDNKVPLNQSKSTETLNNGGASPNGPAGTPSNLPPGYTGGTANNGTSTYKNTKDDVQNGVDYTKQHTVVAPGAINKMDVALLVDKTVSADDLAAAKTAVEGMVGLDPSRGDTLNVASMTFAKPQAASSGAAGLLGDPFALAKQAAIVVAALVFLFLVRKNLRRREGDPVAPEPKWLREIQRTTPIAELGPSQSTGNELASARRQDRQRQAEELVKRNPDQVAMQVAQWMSE